MSIEKLMKKRIDKNLDQIVKTTYKTKSEDKIVENVSKKKRPFPLWAKITIPVTATALVATLAVPILVKNLNNLEKMIAKLSGTYVDMEGVKAFGIGNMPEDGKGPLKLKTIHYLNNSSDEEPTGDIDSSDDNDNNDGSSYSWTSEEQEQYEWEQDYDWDPTKANVLITLDDDGKPTEVVYERTNDKGVVKQNKLGNAASMYVSKNFTYVMYVDDSEWSFWQEINYAQEIRSPSGFYCHHESMQTIIIHNETGKVFALKDIIPQVNYYSGAMNYTMQVDPTKDDFLHINPMYGNEMTQWYKLLYKEEEGLIYKFVLPEETTFRRVYEAREDKYNQTYLLVSEGSYDIGQAYSSDIVNLSVYQVYGDTLLFNGSNALLYGSDNRMYAVVNDRLKVFGEGFSLNNIEVNLEVNLEGMANEFYSTFNDVECLNGICYHYGNGYLYSAFGEVWKVDENGLLHEKQNLEGTFAEYAYDGFMINGEIIGFVEYSQERYGHGGKVVQFEFNVVDEVPTIVKHEIIEATEINCYGHRIIIYQDDAGRMGRGYTKLFLLTVVDGTASARLVAYENNGGMIGVAGQITEPLLLSE